LRKIYSKIKAQSTLNISEAEESEKNAYLDVLLKTLRRKGPILNRYMLFCLIETQHLEKRKTHFIAFFIPTQDLRMENKNL
jgi:hypothetical protein